MLLLCKVEDIFLDTFREVHPSPSIVFRDWKGICKGNVYREGLGQLALMSFFCFQSNVGTQISNCKFAYGITAQIPWRPPAVPVLLKMQHMKDLHPEPNTLWVAQPFAGKTASLAQEWRILLLGNATANNEGWEAEKGPWATFLATSLVFSP